jgi:hypothetical protein
MSCSQIRLRSRRRLRIGEWANRHGMSLKSFTDRPATERGDGVDDEDG